MGRIEVQNEPNKWWRERPGFMTPHQLAAMASAAYDGHEGRLGPGVGAKAADDTFEVVLAAVTGTGRRNLDYTRMILHWAEAFRHDKQFPADVLNFHGYGSSDDEQASDDKSPEELDMQGQLSRLVAWRDAHAPRAAVWDTEFGWDIDQRSVNRAPAYGPWSATDVQAMWHARGFMAAAAAGMDRMQIYMLRDVQPAGTGKFLTSGLVSCKQEFWRPKRSWYTLSTLTTLLGPMRYNRTLGSSEIAPALKGVVLSVGALDVAARVAAGLATSAAVVWSPTKDGSMARGAAVSVGGGAACPAAMTRAELVMNSTNGAQFAISGLAAGAGSGRAGGCVVRLDVSEMPSIILLGAAPQPAIGPVPPISPPPSGICKTASGAALPTGMYCAAALPSWANLTANDMVECPDGTISECADGGLCVATGNATAACAADPHAFCTSRDVGLFCDAAWPKPTPRWPDRYIACPSSHAELCPEAAPNCSQRGLTVDCV
jgi:hypothetical protein